MQLLNMLWLLYLVFYFIGDLLTTVYGYNFLGLSETNRDISSLLEHYRFKKSFALLTTIKLGVTIVLFLILELFNNAYSIAIMSIFVFYGVKAVLNNLYYIIRVHAANN